jgi:hypothetical protein
MINGIHIQTRGLMGGIYEVRRCDRLRCNDIYTKFHKDFFRQSEVYKGDTPTDTQTHKEHDDLISLLIFLQNKDLWRMLLYEATNKQVM